MGVPVLVEITGEIDGNLLCGKAKTYCRKFTFWTSCRLEFPEEITSAPYFGSGWPWTQKNTLQKMLVNTKLRNVLLVDN